MAARSSGSGTGVACNWDVPAISGEWHRRVRYREAKSRAQPNSGDSADVSSRVARCKSPWACDLANASRIRSQKGSPGNGGSEADAGTSKRPCGEMVRTIPMRTFFDPLKRHDQRRWVSDPLPSKPGNCDSNLCVPPGTYALGLLATVLDPTWKLSPTKRIHVKEAQMTTAPGWSRRPSEAMQRNSADAAGTSSQCF